MVKAIGLSTSTKSRGFSKSLQGRFILASLLCLPLFIGASGLLLENAFKDNLLAAEDNQLQTQLYILLGSAEVQSGQLWLPEQLPEPRYAVMNSGLYAIIAVLDPSDPNPANWQSRWRSTSARLLQGNIEESSADFQASQQTFAHLKRFFRLTFDVIWEDSQGLSLPLRFQIYHSRDNYKIQLKRYRQQLWYGLSFLAMGLLIIQVLIMHWGLKPLKKLVRDIQQLAGQPSRQLLGNYPAEIAPVTDSLNLVLSNEQQQRERYQNTLNDLAHSLKTPLAVLQGELQQRGKHQPQEADEASNAIAAEQVERMTTIIRHQLQRAVLQTNKKLHTAQKIRPTVERLCNAMSKVYREKEIVFLIDIAEDCSYSIESQDLFELLGNLIENACKYGDGKVSVAADEELGLLTIRVGDNGNGIAADKKSSILERGTRADTAKPGQGIGLAITTDIVSAYGGSISVGKSEQLGGAQFQIVLPRE